ncbi:MAG: SDR family oxidoreductase [Planctomycetaceae bacterium]|nr:SDR family oxidoreductase [Planctomycetaceae bacterium]
MAAAASNCTVALLTGASRGIGAELARVFAERGHDLVIVARNRADLERLAAELHVQHGTNVTVLVDDLTDRAAPSRIFADLEARGIVIDVLVNNAGFGTWGPFATTDLPEELDLIQVNIAALTHLTKLFLRPMLARGRGKILNVASTASFQPGPIMAVYCASKAYVLSFTEAVAMEVEGSGVTLTALCPGGTESSFQERADMHEARILKGKLMTAREVALQGYHATMRGKTIKIPGLMNKVMAQSVRIAPRRTVAWIAKKILDKA